MMGAIALPPPVLAVLDRGAFCHVAALTPSGPHVTPMVFSVAGDRVWVTTSRRSVKARAWRSDPRVAGLVRAGEEAVAFCGIATTHDALDRSSWARSLAAGPTLTVAATRFTRKNARFFAGYAVDAGRVPLAWTPPGRVFVEIAVERVARFEGGLGAGTWGDGGGGVPTADRFRRAGAGAGPLDALPADVRSALGDGGRAALAVEGADGPAVLPAAWRSEGAGLYAVASEDSLGWARLTSSSPPAALGVDRPSAWRARDMVGAMARGRGDVHIAVRLASGKRSARALAAAAGVDRADVALVRLRCDRVVWWQGWTSGTVAA
jgi:nitroimidazol reductase NimA-like FMN-containing flavoprotein (pyridoxamine 5'-phosphate oxidase superfamily)